VHDLPQHLHRRLLPELRVVVTMTLEQLDLFGATIDARRLVDGLTCLRDVMPQAMEAAVHLANWRPYDDRSVGRSDTWWYAIRPDGLHFEALTETCPRSSWPTKLARRVTWGEIAELVGDDPRRTGLTAWAESLTIPDAWRDLIRPFELWPHPEDWHPGHIAGDHRRPGWPERITAWRDLLEILTDAITRLDAEVTA
jgi:hypothetical protein